MNYITLCYITLYYITLYYITLHYNTLRFVMLCYITLLCPYVILLHLYLSRHIIYLLPGCNFCKLDGPCSNCTLGNSLCMYNESAIFEPFLNGCKPIPDGMSMSAIFTGPHAENIIN